MVCHTILELRIFPIRTIILKGWHMPKATSFNGENLSHSTASLRSYLDMVECWQRTVSCVIYPLAMCLPNRHLCKRETYSAPAELMISCRNTIRVTGWSHNRKRVLPCRDLIPGTKLLSPYGQIQSFWRIALHKNGGKTPTLIMTGGFSSPVYHIWGIDKSPLPSSLECKKMNGIIANCVILVMATKAFWSKGMVYITMPL